LEKVRDEDTLDCLRKARESIPNYHWRNYCAHTEKLIREHAGEMMNTINRGMQTQVIQFVVKDGESDSDPLSGKESEAEIEDDRSKVQIRPLKIPSPVVGQFSPPDLPPEKVRVVFESGEIFACP